MESWRCIVEGRCITETRCAVGEKHDANTDRLHSTPATSIKDGDWRFFLRMVGMAQWSR